MLQILGIFIARHSAGRMPAFSWSSLSQPRIQEHGEERSASRPLLTGHEEQIEEVDEEIAESGLGNSPAYGTTEARHDFGPRIQPSGLQPDHNEWRED